jgi:hypothetical protein
MAVKIKVKGIQPVKEFSPVVEGRKLATIFGCKIYNSDELGEVRQEYLAIAQDADLEIALAKMSKLEQEGDRTSEDFYSDRANYRSVVDAKADSQVKALTDFYKKQIVYIKQASIEVEDENGATKEIRVADTKTATPIESLWASPEECLVVLLDTYFDVPSIKDSLAKDVIDTVLNIHTDAKLGN